MPQVGIKFAGQELTWDEARERAHDPSFPYPPPLIEAMANQRDDAHPSASTVVGCLRRFELQRKLHYFAEANGELPPIMGTAFHDYMDRFREKIIKPGQMTETRLSTLVDTGYGTIEFSGKFDFFDPGVLISDWKKKSYIAQSFEPPKEHIGQVNIYNWLAKMNGYEPAPTWELAYVSEHWAARFQRPTADVGAVGEFVVKRLRKWHQHATNGSLPPPVSQLFQPDAKGKLPAPCGYCPVREQCLAALRRDADEPF